MATIWLLLMASTSSAEAQMPSIPDALFGTAFVKSEVAYSGGVPTGCSVNYKVLVKDNVYKGGAPTAFDGSFGLIKAPGKLGGYVKGTIIDFAFSGGQLRDTKTLPASLYLVTDKGTSTAGATVASTPSDVPQYLFSVVGLPQMLQVIDEALAARKIMLTAARKPGGMDIPVPIELDVVQTLDDGQRIRDLKEISTFADCMLRLAR
jgi:hypothetical protein